MSGNHKPRGLGRMVTANTTPASLLNQAAKIGVSTAILVEPLAYLSDILTRIINGHSNSQIDDLLPWAYAASRQLKAMA